MIDLGYENGFEPRSDIEYLFNNIGKEIFTICCRGPHQFHQRLESKTLGKKEGTNFYTLLCKNSYPLYFCLQRLFSSSPIDKRLVFVACFISLFYNIEMEAV